MSQSFRLKQISLIKSNVVDILARDQAPVCTALLLLIFELLFRLFTAHMANKTEINKFLLAGLAICIILLVVAIVVLAVTLGNVSNKSIFSCLVRKYEILDSKYVFIDTVEVIQSTTSASNPGTTPQSQPCNQNTVEPYYFTVESQAVNFNDVQNNYMKSVSTLQNQVQRYFRHDISNVTSINLVPFASVIN